MKGHAEYPELDKAIEEHARAIVAGDLKAAEAFLSNGAHESHDDLVARASKVSVTNFIALGRAKVGFQHMSKVRFLTDGEPILVLDRWREEDGKWRLVSTENLSGKRSPWSDIETAAAIQAEINRRG